MRAEVLGLCRQHVPELPHQGCIFCCAEGIFETLDEILGLLQRLVCFCFRLVEIDDVLGNRDLFLCSHIALVIWYKPLIVRFAHVEPFRLHLADD